MAFKLIVDKYSVLTIIGEYYFAQQDTTNSIHSFIAQIGQNITQFNSVILCSNRYFSIDRADIMFLYTI